MQALIIKDNFDSPEIFKDLETKLKSLGFRLVVIKSLQNFKEAKNALDQEMPCLYYPNIFLRYENPESIYNFHLKNNKFSNLKIGSKIVSFIPQATRLTHSKLDHLTFTPNIYFNIKNLKVSQVLPNEKPIILLNAHERPIYLQLTLNALKFSFTHPVEVKILLNKPTPEVRGVALNFHKSYPYSEVIECKENSFISATNLLLQWTRSKKFILMEDDFILPPSIKHYFPNWPFQFFDRLNTFDMVGWSTMTENIRENSYFFRNSEGFIKSDWEYDIYQGHLLTAQCLAVNTNFYIEAFNKFRNDYYAAFDQDMHRTAKKICTPSLRGYHIGFNQEMDGFGSLLTRKFPKAIQEHTLESLTTDRKETFYLKDLLDIF